MRTLIANGTIVTADGSYEADVLVDGETIAQVGAGLAGGRRDRGRDDRRRRQVRDPGRASTSTPTWSCRSAARSPRTRSRPAPARRRSAARRRIVDFAVQSKGQSLRAGLDAWHAKAEGNAVVDYGFHMIMSDVNDDTLAEMDALVAEGVPDFKLFTAYPGVFYSDDAAIFRAMQQTGRNGGLIMMHAENGPAIDVVAARARGEGKTDPYYHGVARYPVFEGEATNRVIRLAEAAGVPVYIVHLSATEALEAVRDARDRGAQAFAETCPQYLFLSPRRPGQRVRGREVRVLAAAAHEGPALGAAVDRPREGRPPGRLDGPLPVRLPRAEGARARRLPEGPQRPAGRRGPRRPAPRRRRRRRADLARAVGRRHLDGAGEAVRDVPAQGRHRRRAPTRTSSSTTRTGERTISATTHHMDVDYSCYEGREVQGASDVVLTAAPSSSGTARSPAGRATAGS